MYSGDTVFRYMYHDIKQLSHTRTPFKLLGTSVDNICTKLADIVQSKALEKLTYTCTSKFENLCSSLFCFIEHTSFKMPLRALIMDDSTCITLACCLTTSPLLSNRNRRKKQNPELHVPDEHQQLAVV